MCLQISIDQWSPKKMTIHPRPEIFIQVIPNFGTFFTPPFFGQWFPSILTTVKSKIASCLDLQFCWLSSSNLLLVICRLILPFFAVDIPKNCWWMHIWLWICLKVFLEVKSRSLQLSQLPNVRVASFGTRNWLQQRGAWRTPICGEQRGFRKG